ncbi:MAG: hypothetical protein OEM46_04885 [Ignavibacteria bacterium]|nr:hypothetical protein [Ignavibacteria bacterium]
MKTTFPILILMIVFYPFHNQLFSQNVGSMAYIEVNEIYLPFNNKGVIADVNVPPNGSQGQFAGGGFLFSSGFWLSGYTGNTLWANGVASANLVEDYQAGTVGMDPNDPKAPIYKLTVNDIPFGQSWQDWSDAVDLGADFYDGNGDGIYNPVDLNGNNQWDPDEDKPDLILDETYWCVFNDGVPANLRRWGSEPQGIEIRQTIFASASIGPLGKTIFVRYRIKNAGIVADTLKDIYFGMWADADIGDATDDVYGCDTIRQGVYFFNNTPDGFYGDQVPAFMMDMLTGPHSYISGETFIDVNGNNIYENGIDTPLDTAINFLGPLGIRIFPGAKNLANSSCITSLKNQPGYSDPNNIVEVRNYSTGFNQAGQLLEPCTWPYGEVWVVPCDQVNPYYWCSGDPVGNPGIGWLLTVNRDLRGVGSAGPFTLVKDREVEILVGYEIDRGTTPLGGITAVRAVSDEIQIFYENNFGYPIVSVEDKPTIASSFKLEQNYPNPFNPSTKIKFTIPSVIASGAKQSQMVTLKIYDVLGNEVAILVNEELSAGEYEAEFNSHSDAGQNLPSGVYFYQLRTKVPETSSGQSIVQTKKMVLMK